MADVVIKRINNWKSSVRGETAEGKKWLVDNLTPHIEVHIILQTELADEFGAEVEAAGLTVEIK